MFFKIVSSAGHASANHQGIGTLIYLEIIE
jgi:hypothetical protein